jgi:hypothetical protein
MDLAAFSRSSSWLAASRAKIAAFLSSSSRLRCDSIYSKVSWLTTVLLLSANSALNFLSSSSYFLKRAF